MGTVARLIEFLRELPPDAEVEMEGCDCIGVWNGERPVIMDEDVIRLERAE